MTWGLYRRTNIAEMRPYVPGEDLAGISVSRPDEELAFTDPDKFAQGMIARNPKNHADQWYVASDYFRDNFELITA